MGKYVGSATCKGVRQPEDFFLKRETSRTTPGAAERTCALAGQHVGDAEHSNGNRPPAEREVRVPCEECDR